jgi:general secretion pathway protein G
MNLWRTRRRRGFTLIELMVVMVILVLLAGGITFGVVKYVPKARRARAASDIATLKNCLDAYHLSVGDYPSTEQGLDALIENPGVNNWEGPYTPDKKEFIDPWGNEYFYVCPGNVNQDSYDLSSFGKDAREGGDGEDADINSWEL